MNGAIYGAVGLSTCKLKSPVIIISEGGEIKSSRSEVNSEMKMVFDKDGGR
jgi:hypothetical protein